ncbi:phospholipase D-like domain-containing protein [Aromatoleum aromaticum]|uniref:phospholipase D-like domain-containing protein n=1 Tax=Aromatoleum aromaticum TaxID=551760 RepID=UPI0002D7ACE1|nr:phospholipase D-like domain-containing protein [Aromatoleum aromaticum]
MLLVPFALAACATSPAVDTVGLPVRPSPASVEVRVEHADGALRTDPSPKVVQQLDADRVGKELLVHHLAHVEDALATPLVLGNDAHLLVDGPATYRAMFAAIEKARRRIHLETYILESGEQGDRLARLLAAKRRQGVEIRVLYDSVGSLDTPPRYFEDLVAAGIAVCEFNPVNPLKLAGDPRLSLNNRDHRKLLVIDGQIAFTGGINISGVYRAGSFGSKRRVPTRDEGWRDTHVMVRGPVVSQFEELFNDAWREQRCPSPVVRQATRTERAGSMAMRLVAADPVSERSELYVALMSALDHARKRVWLTYGYFVPDERTLQSLRDAAQRGVDVRLVLPGFSDFWAPFHAGRSHYQDLLSAGVHIYERRDALLHAKTAVIDGVWSSVGSTNLDWRSFVHNFEADVLVLDGAFAQEMEELFRLDQSASHEVTPEQWKDRGVRARLLEWLARRWEYLL